ncbi:hypothetical protein ACFS6H_00585 [Terrimonas rubra]|uniref:Uncharacterized protein n=1 Tax=Terrimonas rubra TaxID=1035890 RepID=A0ABW5ZYR7_9BACT
MKKMILFSTIFWGLSFSKSSKAQSPVVDSLMAINEISYIGKPLDSLITKLPTGYIKIFVRGLFLQKARCITVQYPGWIWIDLHVREFTHMNPIDNNGVWDINLMRKEKLYGIAIYNDINCLKNCDMH